MPCPGCGGLRATHDLTHGDVASALSSNVLGIGLIVWIIALWVRWTVRRSRGESARLFDVPMWGVVTLAVLVTVFTVFRWTPWGAFLAP